MRGIFSTSLGSGTLFPGFRDETSGHCTHCPDPWLASLLKQKVLTMGLLREGPLLQMPLPQ